MKIAISTLILLMLARGANSQTTFQILNTKVEQGGTLVIRIPPQLQKPGVGIKGPCTDYRSKSILPNKSGLVTIGVGVDCEPGHYRVYLTEYEVEVQTNFLSQYVSVTEKTFAEWFRGRLNIPSKATLERLLKDQEIKNNAYNSATIVDDYTSGKYVLPLNNIEVTDEFGTKRIHGTYTRDRKHINIEKITPHGGVDLKAQTPTKVLAINSGRVLLARHLLADGNILIIDHGSGILSLYLHLSRFSVKESDAVRAGQTVAYTGSTGGVPPHLHFMVKVHGISVDPLVFIETLNQHR